MTANPVEHALTLIARIESGDEARAARSRAELDVWRRGSRANEAAFQEARARWRAVGGMAEVLRGAVPKPRKSGSSQQRAKRVAKAGIALALAFIGLVAVRWHLAQPVFERHLATAMAELATVALPDGSRLELDARTRLHVLLYRDRRTVRLQTGEARFDVAADAGRPLSVQTRAGTVHVLGTVFTVSDRGGPVAVTVERGRVVIALPAGEAGSVQLSAGERIAIADGRIGARQPAASQPAPWRTGWLVFDDVPLAAALGSINAYRRVPIVLADERAGHERLTGSFRAADPDAILDLLPRVLQVEVHRGPGEHVEIRSRR